MRTAHITVHSREEAWREAARLFPTDYEKDDGSTERAGYPIYKSTAQDNDSWISDLNTSLELNIWKGKVIETTKIHIEEEVGMKATVNTEHTIENIKTINFTGGVLTIIYKAKDGSNQASQFTKESLGEGQVNIIA